MGIAIDDISYALGELTSESNSVTIYQPSDTIKKNYTNPSNSSQENFYVYTTNEDSIAKYDFTPSYNGIIQFNYYASPSNKNPVI